MPTELEQLMKPLNEMRDILLNAAQRNDCKMDYPRIRVAFEFAKSELLDSITPENEETD